MPNKKDLLNLIKIKIIEIKKHPEPSDKLETELYNLLIELRRINNIQQNENF